MLQDLRFALRQLKHNRAFTALAILTLAVGIAAVTTVFTWANAVLFNPWPRVERASEIRSLATRIDAGSGYSSNHQGRAWVEINKPKPKDGQLGLSPSL